MMHNRMGISGPSAAMRKSRLEGRPSFLPKPRPAGSTDRLSAEIRRPSGVRCSSAEPPRATIGGGRLSREASATKIPLNRRSRSQQGDQSRYGPGGSITPLRVKKYSRATTTPQRTPSEDRSSRSWQASLDRALAFVTVKDQRGISTPAWQRAVSQRVSQSLAARGGGSLLRPLTITRFTDLAGDLLRPLVRDLRLSNDNYVTKVPHLCKMLLYPGVVSKSWLKTVNTLHAFPHALALLAYLLDLLNRLEQPVEDSWLYAEKDELAVLRRDYLIQSWIRFQEPEHQFADLNEEYLRNLQQLLGDDDDRIRRLTHEIQEYNMVLNCEAEQAARCEEALQVSRRERLMTSQRELAAARAAAAAASTRLAHAARDRHARMPLLDAEIEKANAESQQLRREIEEQTMTVQERTKLLDEVDYANRVHHSKTALAEQIYKMVLSKESELAMWQKKTLDSCLAYKHGLVHLSAQYPALATLDVDENSLMSAQCQTDVSQAAGALRQLVTSLQDSLASSERARNALRRHRHNKLDETRAAISSMKALCQREADSLLAEQAAETSEARSWSQHQQELADRVQLLSSKQEATDTVLDELRGWEAQEQEWCSKLSSLNEYIKTTKATAKRTLEEGKQKRAMLICDHVKRWHDIVDKSNVDNDVK